MVSDITDEHNYSKSDYFKAGINKYYSGEVVQTAGFVIGVGVPIIETGIFYWSGKTNYKALAGIEIATVGVGVILYCVGTALKKKGNNMITFGASGINFKF